VRSLSMGRRIWIINAKLRKSQLQGKFRQHRLDTIRNIAMNNSQPEFSSKGKEAVRPATDDPSFQAELYEMLQSMNDELSSLQDTLRELRALRESLQRDSEAIEAQRHRSEADEAARRVRLAELDRQIQDYEKMKEQTERMRDEATIILQRLKEQPTSPLNAIWRKATLTLGGVVLLKGLELCWRHFA
jgi:chromosome segregation ATPase